MKKILIFLTFLLLLAHHSYSEPDSFPPFSCQKPVLIADETTYICRHKTIKVVTYNDEIAIKILKTLYINSMHVKRHRKYNRFVFILPVSCKNSLLKIGV